MEEDDFYAACGLFYRGRVAFHVAKSGYNAGDLEFLRSHLLSLQYEKGAIQQAWSAHRKELERIAAWKPVGKIEYYKKCIKEEEAKLAEEKLRKREQDFNAKLILLKSTAKRINFEFSESDIAPRVYMKSPSSKKEVVLNFADTPGVAIWGILIYCDFTTFSRKKQRH